MKEYLKNRENINKHCYSNPKKSGNELWLTTINTLKIFNQIPSNKWQFLGAGTFEIPNRIELKAESKLEKQFNKYADKWKSETALYSTTLHITRNDNYIDIIALGPEVVPYILQDLAIVPNHWFVALKFLTKENPVPNEHAGNIEQMQQDWLSWGKEKKLI